MSKRTAIRKVARAYRQNMLAQICTLPEASFGPAFGMQTIPTAGGAPADYYHYRDNGSNVLAVAHLDTVVRPNKRTAHFHDTKKGPLIMSGALDDRLGAYVILGLLPKLGVKCDWLLTVGEETAQSTAEYFEPSKQYEWAIEFDRTGTDVVMYQYEDDESCRLVEKAGAPVGFGSFSDIAYLEHLGVKAFNWGVGYRGNYHSESGYAYLNDTFAMVAKYLRFHAQNAGNVLHHDPTPAYAADKLYSGYDSRSKCPVCGSRGSVDYATMICDRCGFCTDCLEHQYDCQCYTPAAGSRLSIPAQADDEESLDDAIAGAKVAWERSTGTGWAGADIALQAETGHLPYGEARDRIRAILRESPLR